MNDYLLSFVLGIVEGLTEFLPVSSTAHLRICESLLGIDLSDSYWKMFSIVIQLGAILCLPIYFRRRLTEFLATFPKGIRGDRTIWTHPATLVMIAFVCTAGPAFLLSKIIGKHLENINLMAAALVVGGIVMWYVDWKYSKQPKAIAYYPELGPRKTKDVDDMTFGQAVWIGLCQILSAVFPGTSRSMSTIAGGQIAGLTRETALEFSFLLSIPTMAAATAYDFLKAVKGSKADPTTAVHIDTHGAIILAIGFVVSFIVAYFVVAWFMGWVRKRGFAPFAIYRIVVGLAVFFFMGK